MLVESSGFLKKSGVELHFNMSMGGIGYWHLIMEEIIIKCLSLQMNQSNLLDCFATRPFGSKGPKPSLFWEEEAEQQRENG